MLAVVFLLQLAPLPRDRDGSLHRIGLVLGVHQDLAAHVARGAANGLNERALGAQETLLVGVEDGHQRHLGQVQPFAQKIDPHQHVERAQSQIAQDLDAFQGVDVRMQIAHAHAQVGVVLSQILGQALGQRGDQHAVTSGDPRADLGQQVINLRSHRPDLDLGIEQPGGPDDLLDQHPGRALDFIVRGRRRHEDDLLNARFPLLEAQRTVVERGGQTEAEIHQGLLARAVALVHGTDLGHGLVRFVHEGQAVLGEVVEQGRRRLAGLAARQMARVVLDALAATHLLQHFEVIERALL